MKIDRKLLVPLAMLAVISVGGAYAFLSLTVMTTVHVTEPLSIVSVMGTGDLAAVSCSSSGSTTENCSVTVSAGAIGGISVTVLNSGSQPIVVTPGGSSDDQTDVALGTPAASTISPGGTSMFAYTVTVSPSAAPNSATLTLTFSR